MHILGHPDIIFSLVDTLQTWISFFLKDARLFHLQTFDLNGTPQLYQVRETVMVSNLGPKHVTIKDSNMVNENKLS